MNNLETSSPIDIPATDATKSNIRDHIVALVNQGTVQKGNFPDEAFVIYPRVGGELKLKVTRNWTSENLNKPVEKEQLDLNKPIELMFMRFYRERTPGIESLFELSSIDGHTLDLNETQVPDTYDPDPRTTAQATENRAQTILTELAGLSKQQ